MERVLFCIVRGSSDGAARERLMSVANQCQLLMDDDDDESKRALIRVIVTLVLEFALDGFD